MRINSLQKWYKNFWKPDSISVQVITNEILEYFFYVVLFYNTLNIFQRKEMLLRDNYLSSASSYLRYFRFLRLITSSNPYSFGLLLLLLPSAIRPSTIFGILSVPILLKTISIEFLYYLNNVINIIILIIILYKFCNSLISIMYVLTF